MIFKDMFVQSVEYHLDKTRARGVDTQSGQALYVDVPPQAHVKSGDTIVYEPVDPRHGLYKRKAENK